MSRTRAALGVAVALAGLSAVAALSHVPYETNDAGRALLRLSWRARGERIERCRRATPAELANVPAHMRREVICEGVHIAPYRLQVAVDGRTVEDRRVAGSGVKGDRPIYLLREFELQPGVHRVRVLFEKASDGRDDPQPARDSSEQDREQQARRGTVPPRLTLDTSVTVTAGAIVLVTYDAERRRLELLGGR